jgi:membrane protein DedA with SNARE-associated domain
MGRRAGESGMKAFIARHGRWVALRQSDIDRSNAWFERHGGMTVFMCRMIPGLRSTISIPAGVAAQNLWAFTAYTVLGSSLWCALLTYCGYALGSRFESVGDYLNPITWLVVGSLFIWYLWRVVHPGE